MLRHALGRHLGVPPDRVPLDRTCPDCGRPHGRPRLAGAAGGPELSVSHSGRWVAVAAHLGGPVGVDVEQVKEDLDVTALARITMAPDERRSLAEAPDRAAAFTRLWCRKEAVVKLTGDGLRADLAEVEVTGYDEPAALLRWPRHPALPGRLVLRDLDTEPGYAACLAVLADGPVRVAQHRAATLFDDAPGDPLPR
jgi:4'-phosphopantetheinyl transferase